MPRIKETETTATSAKSKIATDKSKPTIKVTLTAVEDLKTKVEDNTYNINENYRKLLLFEDRTSEAVNNLTDNFDKFIWESKQKQHEFEMKFSVIFALLGITIGGILSYIILNI